MRGSQAEIDYVITVEDKIVPLEVKSGKYGRLKSLHIFYGNTSITIGISFHQEPFNTTQNIWSVLCI